MTSTESERFPSGKRILKRREFLAIQQQGSKLNTRDLLLFVVPAVSVSSRIGITVSKRVDKRSSQRNKIRRRIREILRRILPRMQIALDIVVVARGSSLESSYRSLENQILQVLSKRQVL